MNARHKLDIGFASAPPNTFLVHGTEVNFFSVPHGVRVAAFESNNSIRPAGIIGGKIIGVESDTPGAVCCDIVFKVEQDQELLEALANDMRERLKQCGFVTRLWLLSKPADNHTYAYLRALEKDHE